MTMKLPTPIHRLITSKLPNQMDFFVLQPALTPRLNRTVLAYKGFVLADDKTELTRGQLEGLTKWALDHYSNCPHSHMNAVQKGLRQRQPQLKIKEPLSLEQYLAIITTSLPTTQPGRPKPSPPLSRLIEQFALFFNLDHDRLLKMTQNFIKNCNPTTLPEEKLTIFFDIYLASFQSTGGKEATISLTEEDYCALLVTKVNPELAGYLTRFRPTKDQSLTQLLRDLQEKRAIFSLPRIREVLFQATKNRRLSQLLPSDLF